MKEVEYTRPVNITLPEYLYNYLVEITSGKISKAKYVRNLIEFDYSCYKQDGRTMLSIMNEMATEAPAKK